MRSTAVVVWLSMLCCVSVAKAGESGSAELCRSVAHDLWAGIATEPLHEQTPLAQLPKIARGEDGLVKSGQLVEFPYGTFADQVLFPVRLDDGDVYMGRMGRGGFGWRQTADTLLALDRLRGDQLVPAAGVYVSAGGPGSRGSRFSSRPI